jgi:hypothetical protein
MDRRPLTWMIPSLALLMLAAAGCAGPLGPRDGGQYELRVGTLTYFQDSVHVSIPDRVRAGEAFEVRAWTFGNGCLQTGETRVHVANRVASITPYDRHPRPRARIACPDILRSNEHRATLVFQQAGSATVRIHGMREPGRELITVERSVVVEAAE